MVQRKRFPETATGSARPVPGIRRRRPQRRRRTGIRGLGLLGVQEHSADRIQGASTPWRVIQLPEPYQFSFAGQRYRIANLRSNPVGCWSARDSGGAKISFLMPKLNPFSRRVMLGPVVSVMTSFTRSVPINALLLTNSRSEHSMDPQACYLNETPETA